MHVVWGRCCGMALLVWIALSVGCSSSPPAANAPAANGEDPAAKPPSTLSIPGQEAAPAEPAHGGMLHWAVPAGWVDEAPSSSMRLAQYRVPGEAGDAQCVVFYFGPGQGGDALANARRWAGQFSGPDGKPLQDFDSQRIEGTAVPVMVVEVRGTYSGGMTTTMDPAEPQPGAMLLGAIADGPDAPWFFKMTGPEATVEGQRQAFLTLLRSIHVAESM